MRKPITILLVATGLVLQLSACSNAPKQEDPLKNTKQLVKRGHGDLYDNGAFQVPNTKISLIPPGPSAMEFAKELAGVRARQSFEQSLENARDAVYVVADGTRKSFTLASELHDDTNEVANYITAHSRPNSKLLIYKAYPKTKEIIGESWQLADRVAHRMEEGASGMIAGAAAAGEGMREAAKATEGTLGKSWELAKSFSSDTNALVGEGFATAGEAFVQGYAALPRRLSERWGAQSQSPTLDKFAANYEASLAYRESRSEFYGEMVSASLSDYSDGVSDSFANAAAAFDQAGETGFSLATLKAARWVLQGIFWDGLIKPVGGATVGSVGYLTVNTVTFPVMLVASESVPVAEVAVEVAWNSAATAYEVVAPTASAAVASLFSLTGMAIGQTAAGGAIAGGAIAEGSGYLVKGAATVVETGGKVAGKSVSYIGVPLTTAGIKIAGSAAGVVVGGAQAGAGGALFIAGEGGALATQAAGNLAAGTTLAVGTVASTVAGAGLGVYELSKAVVVPTGYTLGSGIVLGYGTTSQLAAHSILAVSDAAYLVLSLEGPRWVVYAVKGDLNKGDDLAVGTMLDLEQMQTSGETFYELPVSDEELSGLLEALPEELPEAP